MNQRWYRVIFTPSVRLDRGLFVLKGGDTMIDKPMDVLQQFPVRKSKAQKASFRDSVQSYVTALGYTCTEERGRYGSRNVVIGNPETAKYLITAHYDTCARMYFPNIVTPTNVLTYLAYQMAIVFVYLAACAALGALVFAVTSDRSMSFLIGWGVYWVLLYLMMYGPANLTNANDNTSGVVTVLEIARNLPAGYRDRVCFVLFDLEEAGLIGSASYFRQHKKHAKEQLVLNLDCVGDGDEMILFPGKKVKKNRDAMDSLRSICGSWGEKSLKLHEKGYSFYPSDQSNFPLGVAIGAFHRKKWIGPYYSRIHTHKDTILEEENVMILCRRMIQFISGTAE